MDIFIIYEEVAFGCICVNRRLMSGMHRPIKTRKKKLVKNLGLLVFNEFLLAPKFTAFVQKYKASLSSSPQFAIHHDHAEG